jgi:ADP-dependent phosphofructokinase/glucokinase
MRSGDCESSFEALLGSSIDLDFLLHDTEIKIPSESRVMAKKDFISLTLDVRPPARLKGS